MDRIKLNKREKQVLRLLDKGNESCPSFYPSHVFSACIDSLERKGFAKGSWASGHELIAARLTDAGRTYLALNPNLRNPIDWAKVAAVASCIAVIVAVIALLVGCSMLK